REMHLAPALVHHPAEHLREPVVDGPEDAEDAAHEQHVVDVADDEVGVVDGDVHRRGGPGKTGQAADHEQGAVTKREENGAQGVDVVKGMFAPHNVPSQLRTFAAEGRAIKMVAIMKPVPRRGSMPLWNMWWPQTMKPSPAMPAIEYTIGR